MTTVVIKELRAMGEKKECTTKHQLSDHLKKHFGFWAGLRFWKPTNSKGSVVLISRHWPHIIPWSWSVWVSWSKWPIKWGHYRKPNGYMYLNFTLLFVNFSINSQPDDWMVKQNYIDAYLDGDFR